MKILCDITYTPNPLSTKKQNRYNRHVYNLATIAQQLGHQAIIYNGQAPLLQILDEWKPELYLGKCSSTSKTIYDSNIKSVIILDEDERYLSSNPDLVVTLDDEHAYSAEHLNQLPAVNAVVHVNGKVKPEWKSDIVYIGNRILEKEAAFKKILLPLIKHRDVKIFSTDPFLPWSKEAVGVIMEEDKRHLYKSANICLHFSSSHLSSRPFEILGAGGVCYATKDEKLEKIFGDRLNYVENFTDVLSIKAEDRAKDNMKFILTNHTFLQRWNEIYERVA